MSLAAATKDLYSIFDPDHSHSPRHSGSTLSPEVVTVKREPEPDQLLHGDVWREAAREDVGEGPPKKRRRTFRTTVEVVLPTLREVDMKRRLSIKPDLDSKEEEEKKNFALLHAKVKVKVKEEAAISDDVVQSRLALIGYETYDIKVEPPEILDATTTRDFTSTTWGGNRIWTFPRIQQKFVNIHGLNDFMFCNLEYNPAVPRWPGAPGLYFESWRSFQDWPRIQRVLVRLRDNAWHYVGQYQLTPAPALTGEEWRCQTDIVKNTWAQNLSFRMYGRHVRASIVLRKRFGREASEDELSTAMESNGKFDVPAHEILQAYDRGEMHLQVWCMKCVGYDEDFQRKIAAGNQAPARRVRG